MKAPLRTTLNVLGWLCCAAALLALAGVIAASVAYTKYQKRAAQFDLSKIRELPERSAIIDANGELYSYLDGENRLIVSLERVPKHFIDALLAREDARFWQHDGVDYRGIARAAFTNLSKGAVRQGASTITQQLARNAFHLRGRTLDRKALEAVLAQRMEKQFSKQEILGLYLNRIYFGSGFHGIEAAARGYFAKPAEQLTVSESAMLAGLIRSPNNLSPARNLEAAITERDTVIDRMAELQMLTTDQAAAAKAAQITVARSAAMRFRHDYVTDAVARELETLIAREVIDFGGLRIYATVDPQLQRLAQAAADHRLTEVEAAKGFPHPKKQDFQPTPEGESDDQESTDYLQAALVAIDNRTGAIRAIVGGRDFAHSKYPRALLSKRQIGSTFKPFVYAAAFQKGLLPGTLVDDAKIRPGELRVASTQGWSPANSDDEYAGLQPAAFGLIKSRNTMTVRVGEYAGLTNIRELAASAGIGDAAPDLPVTYLGAFESTVRDLTAAYTVFPNLGVRRTPHLVARVEDRSGRILWSAEDKETKVLEPDTAWMVSQILQESMKSGTAAKAASLGWKKPGAGKTGTTNDFYDAWFVGYTATLTCGVWVGMDKPQTIQEKGYGSALALPIWVDFMQQVPEKLYPAKPFEPPEQLAQVRICSVSGARATAGCEQTRNAYEAALPARRLPGSNCSVHPEPQPALAVTEVANDRLSGAAQIAGAVETGPSAAMPGAAAPIASSAITTTGAERAVSPSVGPNARALSQPPAPLVAAPVEQREPITRDRSPAPRVSSNATPRRQVISPEPPIEPAAPARRAEPPSDAAVVQRGIVPESDDDPGLIVRREPPPDGQSRSARKKVRRAVPVQAQPEANRPAPEEPVDAQPAIEVRRAEPAEAPSPTPAKRRMRIVPFWQSR